MAAPTFNDLYDLGKSEAQARRPSLQFREGDVSDMLLSGSAAIADRLIGFIAERIKATFVDGASGDDLSILANDHWGIIRTPATKAQGTVTFSRVGTPAVTLTIPSGTVVTTSRDVQGRAVQFVTLSPLSWGSGIGGAKSTSVEASVTGITGNVAALAINGVVNTLTETIPVSNAALTAGGAEAEADGPLRERIRLFSSTLRRGTLSALEYGAKTVAGVTKATASETATGLVTLYVSDSSGGSTTPMVANVLAEIQNWRAAGAVVAVLGGVLLPVDVQISLTVRAGTNVAVLISAVTAAITDQMALQEIGQTLYRTTISQVVRNVDPRNILEATVLLRTGANIFAAVGIAPLSGEIIRAGSVSVA